MRKARCACGKLTVDTTAEPKLVIMCHCEECQRRTGAPFGVSAYFDENDVTIAGDAKVYERIGDAGRSYTGHFCPTCGTTVHWRVEFEPTFIGVAAGCFSDPDFPPPQRSVFERSKHAWVDVPHGIPTFETSSVLKTIFD